MTGKGASPARERLLMMAPFECFSTGRNARVTFNNPRRLTARCCSITSGIAIYDDLSNLEVIEQHFAVNLLGLLKVTRAFLPVLTNSKGAIINNLSLAGLAPLPVIPSYSLSKAAALNLTQSLRALLAGQGVTVHAVVLGPLD